MAYIVLANTVMAGMGMGSLGLDFGLYSYGLYNHGWDGDGEPWERLRNASVQTRPSPKPKAWRGSGPIAVGSQGVGHRTVGN